MTFCIGDKVKIKDIGYKNTYKKVINQVGFIADIMRYHSAVVNAEVVKYYVDVPNHRNEYQANGHYVFDNTDCLELVKEPEWYGYTLIDPVEPKITIKKENKTMEILNLYNDIKRDEVRQKRKKELEKLKNSHPVIKAINEFRNSMKDVKGLTFSYNYVFEKDAEFDAKIEKLNEKYDKKLAEIDAEFIEIRAMLTECETYEQKQNILKAYGVIDEHGKLRK